MILIMIIIIMMSTSVKLFERPNKSAPFFPAREYLRACGRYEGISRFAGIAGPQKYSGKNMANSHGSLSVFA